MSKDRNNNRPDSSSAGRQWWKTLTWPLLAVFVAWAACKIAWHAIRWSASLLFSFLAHTAANTPAVASSQGRSSSSSPASPGDASTAASAWRGYEHDQMRLRWFAILLVAFVILAVIWHVSIWFVMIAFANNSRPVDDPKSILPQSAFAAPGGNYPPLQPNPAHDRLPQDDLRLMRQWEDELFEHLGWARDPATGGAYLPPTSLVEAVAKRWGTAPAPPAPPHITRRR